MAKIDLNKFEKGNLVREYTNGSAKIKIYDKYISVTEDEKKNRDYSIGMTILTLLSEIADFENSFENDTNNIKEAINL